jgi:hypothetical protein
MTGLYRISSNEVIRLSVANQSFTDRDTNLWGVITDPPTPDGTETRDPSGDLRVLGYSKILDAGTARNATQPEIDGFAAAETADENVSDREAARALLRTHPTFRKLMKAYSDVLVGELNALRQWQMNFKLEVANANNLSALKAGVAALPNLPDRALSQVDDAVFARIDEDD